jgi:hypothetical protein
MRAAGGEETKGQKIERIFNSLFKAISGEKVLTK